MFYFMIHKNKDIVMVKKKCDIIYFFYGFLRNYFSTENIKFEILIYSTFSKEIINFLRL